MARKYEIIDWLNSNSGAVNAISAAILVGITGVYAYLTRCQVIESKKLGEGYAPHSSRNPEINEVHNQYHQLRLENIGGGAAHNIRLQTSREQDLPTACAIAFACLLSAATPEAGGSVQEDDKTEPVNDNGTLYGIN